eukprot:SAG22_NODE_1174_length_5252_cov_177.072579_6_plen_82_part_00
MEVNPAAEKAVAAEPTAETEPEAQPSEIAPGPAGGGKLQEWIETVATGERDLPPLGEFASVSLADVQPGENRQQTPPNRRS